MEESIKKLENGEISSSVFVTKTFNQQITSPDASPDKSNAQVALDLLNKRQRELERDLRSAVCANSDELLQNATDVKFLRDNVTNLKCQVTRAKRETEAVAATLLDPFQSIQTAAMQLNSMYSTCRELRTLLAFLGHAKQAKPNFIYSKIDRLSNDIRGLCEMYKIAKSNELNKIVVFQRFWAKIKPNCDKMINVAEKQFSDSIETQNLDSATNAAVVFICLGNIHEVAIKYYSKYSSLLNSNRFDKSSADTIFTMLQNDFQNVSITANKISIIYQSIQNAIIKYGEPDLVNNFNIDEINPNKAVTDYSITLKKILTKVSSQHSNIGNEIVTKIPNIRKEILLSTQKLPSSMDQNSAFSTIASVFSSFQESFVKETSDEIRRLFFNSFLTASGDAKAVSLNCEAIQNRLQRFDRDLLMKFKDPVVNLAHHFVKMKNAPKESLRRSAMNSQNIVAENLTTLAMKLFSDDVGAQVSRILT
ncbi:hypothetical protein TRFO_03561 [Tritrichomonas foetus]|uniref:Conserved oligomeric Golgi complex subunit 5 N-terminal domain-containing protein n=1 Tax=Tritrichomonas foetus TaxID=1144522 RepID=A0A1J4KNQ8_9EUKA|nr:hypothetical protein TRFO_03561 [Tritrichomonas foetus]|eukprot:OHT12560.1 hypothetical protein TRFO_03561 [Tritrichomonas foetus]